MRILLVEYKKIKEMNQVLHHLMHQENIIKNRRVPLSPSKEMLSVSLLIYDYAWEGEETMLLKIVLRVEVWVLKCFLLKLKRNQWRGVGRISCVGWTCKLQKSCEPERGGTFPLRNSWEILKVGSLHGSSLGEIRKERKFLALFFDWKCMCLFKYLF